MKNPSVIIFRQDVAKLLAIVLILGSALMVAVGLSASHYTEKRIDAEFKKAILSEKDVQVREFQFFTSAQGKRHISYQIKNVKEIEIAGAGDEGRRQTWGGK